MSFDVRITPKALAELAALREPIVSRVNSVMQRLTDWPNVSGAKPLRGNWKGCYRVRTGDWRIVFQVVGNLVIVQSIADRRDVYEE